MKAVNLIPTEQRRGGGSPSTNALLGALALILVGVVAYVLTTNQISSRKDDLARAKQRNATVSGQLTALKPYVDFASLKDSRSKTVHDLAASRFNWQRAMSDLSHVTTHQVWLTGMTATVAPGVDVQSSGAGATSTLRGALPNPAVELSGCAVSNNAVVSYMSRLRAIKRVVRVTLDSAQKPNDSGGGGATATAGSTSTGSTGSCGTGENTPAFAAVVFFAPLPASATDSTSATATPAATSSGATSSTSGSSTSTTPTTSNTSNTSGSTR